MCMSHKFRLWIGPGPPQSPPPPPPSAPPLRLQMQLRLRFETAAAAAAAAASGKAPPSQKYFTYKFGNFAERFGDELNFSLIVGGAHQSPPSALLADG